MGFLSKAWKKVKKGASKVWDKVKKPVLAGSALLGGAGLMGMGPAAGLLGKAGAGIGSKLGALGKLGSSAKGAASSLLAFGTKHSGILGAGAGLLGQQMANTASAQQAGREMDWQERMSSTAHQRQVEDLKAAGLNPILSANSGASAGGGAMGQVGNIGAAAVSSAVDARRSREEVRNMQEQNAFIRAQTNQVNAQTQELVPWQKYLLQHQADQSAASAYQARAQGAQALHQGRRTDQDANYFQQHPWALGMHLSGGGAAGIGGAAVHTAGSLFKFLKSQGGRYLRRP